MKTKLFSKIAESKLVFFAVEKADGQLEANEDIKSENSKEAIQKSHEDLRTKYEKLKDKDNDAAREMANKIADKESEINAREEAAKTKISGSVMAKIDAIENIDANKDKQTFNADKFQEKFENMKNLQEGVTALQEIGKELIASLDNGSLSKEGLSPEIETQIRNLAQNLQDAEFAKQIVEEKIKQENQISKTPDYFTGTPEQWQEVEKAKGLKGLMNTLLKLIASVKNSLGMSCHLSVNEGGMLSMVDGANPEKQNPKADLDKMKKTLSDFAKNKETADIYKKYEIRDLEKNFVSAIDSEASFRKRNQAINGMQSMLTWAKENPNQDTDEIKEAMKDYSKLVENNDLSFTKFLEMHELAFAQKEKKEENKKTPQKAEAKS